MKVSNLFHTEAFSSLLLDHFQTIDTTFTQHSSVHYAISRAFIKANGAPGIREHPIFINIYDSPDNYMTE